MESLFESYRRWILNTRPYGGDVTKELESISATAAIERRLFDQTAGDVIGNFGRFADAFDVSTAMPLVLYLATEPEVGSDLDRALSVLESYILRRDICGLTTKNYNRLFVGIIDRLRSAEGNKVDALLQYLSSRQSDIDRWPDDIEWQRAWIGRDQYKGSRQARLRYIFEAIELAKRTALNEDIEIKSALTVEHIMPQKWRTNWPIPGFDHLDDDDVDPDHVAAKMERDSVIDNMGNLTLLTHSLNASVSNGPYSVKMPAVRSHSSLALNRELNAYNEWNETSIASRGLALFGTAKGIWTAPCRPPAPEAPENQSNRLPEEGTMCRFSYAGAEYTGTVINERLVVNGIDTPFATFSAASKAITQTSRNGWNDWYVRDAVGGWTLADDWRKG
ncbi:HNH endonuclease family protein [Pelagibacterium flavum]|uniref:HNH endonuclease family protein n=1 Tax=Pelagibacterium flavum TaxID=2984530 RepID=A0ABY6IJR8_9HYPH|nr:HNH endonuclease family protein [Pelagibacterium sp. YIM 151497]UYQ70846.1 HNH endonuclease family protein [Pelagibacterium sp. YIM 151497]